MAYRISKVDPLDLQKRKAVGINIPFSGNAGFVLNYETRQAIKNNVANYLMTGKGERYMNPTFGTTLRNYLFEQINVSTLEQMESYIAQELRFNFNNIRVSTLKIEPDTDTNSIKLVLNYQINHTSIDDSISINFI